MPRTNIAIADDVADELSAEAIRRNKTLYAFANESLSAVVSVCKLSGAPSDVLPSWRMGRMLKEMDAVPLPGDLVEKFVKKLFDADKDWLLRTWLTEGRRVGSYLRMGYPELQDLAQAAVEFQGLLPLKKLEVRESDQGDSKGHVLVRAVGAGLSMETTSCAEQFLRGIAEEYSWKAKGTRTAEGIIEMELVKGRLEP